MQTRTPATGSPAAWRVSIHGHFSCVSPQRTTDPDRQLPDRSCARYPRQQFAPVVQGHAEGPRAPAALASNSRPRCTRAQGTESRSSYRGENCQSTSHPQRLPPLSVYRPPAQVEKRRPEGDRRSIGRIGARIRRHPRRHLMQHVHHSSDSACEWCSALGNRPC